MKFSVCKIISLFIKLLGSFLVLFSSVSAFHYKHKKIVNSFIRFWGSGIPVSQIRKPTIYSRAFSSFLFVIRLKFSRFQNRKEKRKRLINQYVIMSICLFYIFKFWWNNGVKFNGAKIGKFIHVACHYLAIQRQNHGQSPSFKIY